ncbi:MAG: SLC26A/SulP transporter family protein [Planctomycetota bacterium]
MEPQTAPPAGDPTEAKAPAPEASEPSAAGDLWGALASMLVALPSAIAFGVLVFTPLGKEFVAAGALAGALGAAALGLTAPFIGRNGGFVTAPCAPAAAVMSGFAAAMVAAGTEPPRLMALMVLVALLAAAFQVLAGLVRLGRLIKFLPYQVVSGYLSGVAVIIALGQLPKLLGAQAGKHLGETLRDPGLWRWEGIVVGLVTIAVTAGAPRLTRKVPAAILGLLAGVVAYGAIAVFRPELRSLAGNALVIGPLGSELGQLWAQTAARARGVTALHVSDIALVLGTAATLAALLSIDTLKTGVVLEALTRRQTDSNRELVGQGVANAVSALVGGMPGAGTMGPTLVNVTSGGRTPRSGLFEGALCALAFLALSGLIAWVPIGALAGILLVVAFKMFDWQIFGLLRNPETRLDFAVIAAVILVAETVGLIQASVTGVALAVLLFIRAQAGGSVILRRRDLSKVASRVRRLEDARRLLDRHGSQGLLVELQGDLFFGTTDQLRSELAEDVATRRYILLDLRRVQSVDYTGAHLLHILQEQLAERGGTLLLAGLPSSMPTRQDIQRYLGHLGLFQEGEHEPIPVHETRDGALEWMEERVLEDAGWTRPAASAPPLGLREVELFREFDEPTLARIGEAGKELQLASDQQLFAQGDQGDELYLVLAGGLDVYLPLPGGKRHHVATIERGDYVGEVLFLDRGGMRTATAVARKDTRLLELSRARFNEVAMTDALIPAKVFARLARGVSRRLRSADAELRALEER